MPLLWHEECWVCRMTTCPLSTTHSSVPMQLHNAWQCVAFIPFFLCLNAFFVNDRVYRQQCHSLDIHEWLMLVDFLNRQTLIPTVQQKPALLCSEDSTLVHMCSDKQIKLQAAIVKAAPLALSAKRGVLPRNNVMVTLTDEGHAKQRDALNADFLMSSLSEAQNLTVF